MQCVHIHAVFNGIGQLNSNSIGFSSFQINSKLGTLPRRLARNLWKYVNISFLSNCIRYYLWNNQASTEHWTPDLLKLKSLSGWIWIKITPLDGQAPLLLWLCRSNAAKTNNLSNLVPHFRASSALFLYNISLTGTTAIPLPCVGMERVMGQCRCTVGCQLTPLEDHLVPQTIWVHVQCCSGCSYSNTGLPSARPPLVAFKCCSFLKVSLRNAVIATWLPLVSQPLNKKSILPGVFGL